MDILLKNIVGHKVLIKSKNTYVSRKHGKNHTVENY